ncbi:unannotated protein [freshwater metagenome]|uniref:Unannotated protein n=1 Tax=freshwater metagenome TaxID=449393 RepID=A0A6J5ZL68_9ZZZZ
MTSNLEQAFCGQRAYCAIARTSSVLQPVKIKNSLFANKKTPLWHMCAMELLPLLERCSADSQFQVPVVSVVQRKLRIFANVVVEMLHLAHFRMSNSPDCQNSCVQSNVFLTRLADYMRLDYSMPKASSLCYAKTSVDTTRLTK